MFNIVNNGFFILSFPQPQKQKQFIVEKVVGGSPFHGEGDKRDPNLIKNTSLRVAKNSI